MLFTYLAIVYISWKQTYFSEVIFPVHHYRYTYIFLKGEPLDVHRIKSPDVFMSARLLLSKTLEVWKNFIYALARVQFWTYFKIHHISFSHKAKLILNFRLWKWLLLRSFSIYLFMTEPILVKQSSSKNVVLKCILV